MPLRPRSVTGATARRTAIGSERRFILSAVIKPPRYINSKILNSKLYSIKAGNLIRLRISLIQGEETALLYFRDVLIRILPEALIDERNVNEAGLRSSTGIRFSSLLLLLLLLDGNNFAKSRRAFKFSTKVLGLDFNAT